MAFGSKQRYFLTVPANSSAFSPVAGRAWRLLCADYSAFAYGTEIGALTVQVTTAQGVSEVFPIRDEIYFAKDGADFERLTFINSGAAAIVVVFEVLDCAAACFKMEPVLLGQNFVRNQFSVAAGNSATLAAIAPGTMPANRVLREMIVDLSFGGAISADRMLYVSFQQTGAARAIKPIWQKAKLSTIIEAMTIHAEIGLDLVDANANFSAVLVNESSSTQIFDLAANVMLYGV